MRRRSDAPISPIAALVSLVARVPGCSRTGARAARVVVGRDGHPCRPSALWLFTNEHRFQPEPPVRRMGRRHLGNPSTSALVARNPPTLVHDSQVLPSFRGTMSDRQRRLPRHRMDRSRRRCRRSHAPRNVALGACQRRVAHGHVRAMAMAPTGNDGPKPSRRSVSLRKRNHTCETTQRADARSRLPADVSTGTTRAPALLT